jgi:hypothetical protein
VTRFEVSLIPASLVVIGLIRQIVIERRRVLQINQATEFLGNFIQWCNGEGADHSLYNWMLSKSDTVQTMLAGHGLISFRPAFANFTHSNYPVILNAIPEIQKEFAGDLRSFNVPFYRSNPSP